MENGDGLQTDVQREESDSSKMASGNRSEPKLEKPHDDVELQSPADTVSERRPNKADGNTRDTIDIVVVYDGNDDGAEEDIAAPTAGAPYGGSVRHNNVVNDSNLTSRLIWSVSQRRVLYDLSCPSYKDHQSRSRAWKDIAEELDIPVTECQIKWSTLRRCLANARKRQMRRKAKGCGKLIKKWRYQDEMSFLMPFLDIREIEPANRDSTSAMATNSFLMNSLLTHQQYRDSDDDALVSYTAGGMPPPVYFPLDYEHFYRHQPNSPCDPEEQDVKPSLDHLFHSSFQYEAAAPSSVKKDFLKAQAAYPQLDELDTFFLSMSKSIKTLPRLQQLNIRSQVFNIVTEAELKLLQSQQRPKEPANCTGDGSVGHAGSQSVYSPRISFTRANSTSFFASPSSTDSNH